MEETHISLLIVSKYTHPKDSHPRGNLSSQDHTGCFDHHFLESPVL